MATAELLKTYAQRFIGDASKEPQVIRAYCWYYLLARVAGDDRWRAVYSKPCRDLTYLIAINGNEDEREALANMLVEFIAEGDIESLGLFIANDEISGNKFLHLIGPEILEVVIRRWGIGRVKIMLGQSSEPVGEGQLFNEPWLFLGRLLARRGSPWTRVTLEL